MISKFYKDFHYRQEVIELLSDEPVLEIKTP